MKEEKLWKDELDALLGKLVDDGLTVADKARLNKILQTEPGAREFYHEYLDLHGALEERLGVPDFSPLNAVIDPETKEESKPVFIPFGGLGMGGSGRGGDWVVYPVFSWNKRKPSPSYLLLKLRN